MNAIEQLDRISEEQKRFPYDLPDKSIIFAMECVKEEHIVIYEDSINTFLDTGIVDDVELLQQSINYLRLKNYIMEKNLKNK